MGHPRLSVQSTQGRVPATGWLPVWAPRCSSPGPRARRLRRRSAPVLYEISPLGTLKGRQVVRQIGGSISNFVVIAGRLVVAVFPVHGVVRRSGVEAAPGPRRRHRPRVTVGNRGRKRPGDAGVHVCSGVGYDCVEVAADASANGPGDTRTSLDLDGQRMSALTTGRRDHVTHVRSHATVTVTPVRGAIPWRNRVRRSTGGTDERQRSGEYACRDRTRQRSLQR